MGKFDITLKDIFYGDTQNEDDIPQRFVEIISGKKPVKLLPPTLPTVKDLTADLVIGLEDNSVLHIEFQSTNDPDMPIRMLNYYAALKKRYKQLIVHQALIYVGDEPLRMAGEFRELENVIKYRLVDIRDIPCQELMESNSSGDKALSVLCNIDDLDKFLGEIVRHVLKLKERQRAKFLHKLVILSRLREEISRVITNAIKEGRMPIRVDPEKVKETDWYYHLGMEKGEEKKLREAVVKMYNNLKLSPEQISTGLEIPLKKVKKILKEEGLIKEK